MREEAAELRRRQRSLINDVYRIHIPGNRRTYIQLLTPFEGWVRVRLHEQLPVGTDDEGTLVYRSFVSPKDPGLGGEAAEDPVEERTLKDGGWAARDRLIGLAAELTRLGGGFELATRVEDGVTIPNIGLIVQANQNFFAPLAGRPELREWVIAVRKSGQRLETTYEFERAGEPIEIEYTFDLARFIDHLADETEMERVLESLPPEWYFSRGNRR